MRRLPLLVPCYALAITFVAAASSAQDIQGTSSYKAEDFVGNIDDFKILAEEALKAKWILTKAAKVEGLTLQKDAGKITLDGYVFLKEPIRGLTTEAQFFGKGRFELRPPIAMERQQVKRFLGTEAIDAPLVAARIEIASLEDETLFEGLDYTEANATAAKENDRAKGWMENSEEFYTRGRTKEQQERAKYEAYWNAFAIYQRLLHPKAPSPFSAEMSVDVPKEKESLVHLQGLQFFVIPASLEEVSVVGLWDHGKHKARSIITAFNTSSQYGTPLDYAATSASIEAEDKRVVGVDKNELRLTIAPGENREIAMTSVMDVRVLKDDTKELAFRITPYIRATKAWIDGVETAFVQPQIPDTVPPAWAPAIVLLLPRAYARNEHVAVKIELEGKILWNYDGYTWIVRDEDVWFPNPSGEGGFYATKFDTTIRVPKDFTAVSNGAETPCRPEDVVPDMECFRNVTKGGIDWATFNVGRGIKIDRGESLSGVPIAVYTNAVSKVPFSFLSSIQRDEQGYVKGVGSVVKREYSLTKAAPAVLNKARAAIAIYENWFGPFPYERLALTPHPKGHGRGFASLLLLSQHAFLSDAALGEIASITGNTPDPWSIDSFITHEIAHQWWGGKVGIRDDRSQWFSEGFANYGAILCLEAFDDVDGTDYMRGELLNYVKPLLEEDGYLNTVAPLALGNRVASAQNREGFQHGLVRQDYMYGKGCLVLHMLRTLARKLKEPDIVAGDELFRKALNEYVAAQRDRAPSNLDMQKSLSRSYGMDLSWFFDQWVYGLGVPKLEFSHEIATVSGKPVLRGRIRQKDTAFKFPVAVVMHWGKGKNERTGFYYQWVTEKDQTFEQPLDERPDRVTINDDYGVLASVKDVPWTQSAAGQ